MVTDSRFRLERPPVKRVTLTVNFRAEPRLQGWHLDAFFHYLGTRYLSREEVPPRPSADAETYEFLPPVGWPIPRTVFAGDDRSLSVQSDELELVWNFGEANRYGYPGFESLMEELDRVLNELVSSVSEHDVDITPTEVECFYVNEIEGMTAPQLAVGVLTDWAEVDHRPVPDKGYVGVRLHGCRHPEEHNCSSWVMVDSVDDGPPRLAIRVGRLLKEGEAASAVMRQAHDELIGLFRSHTPDRLRTEWGES